MRRRAKERRKGGGVFVKTGRKGGKDQWVLQLSIHANQRSSRYVSAATNPYRLIRADKQRSAAKSAKAYQPIF